MVKFRNLLLLRSFAKCLGKSEHRVVKKVEFIFHHDLFVPFQIREIGTQGWRDWVYKSNDILDEKKRLSVL